MGAVTDQKRSESFSSDELRKDLAIYEAAILGSPSAVQHVESEMEDDADDELDDAEDDSED